MRSPSSLELLLSSNPIYHVNLNITIPAYVVQQRHIEILSVAQDFTPRTTIWPTSNDFPCVALQLPKIYIQILSRHSVLFVSSILHIHLTVEANWQNDTLLEKPSTETG